MSLFIQVLVDEVIYSCGFCWHFIAVTGGFEAAEALFAQVGKLVRDAASNFLAGGLGHCNVKNMNRKALS